MNNIVEYKNFYPEIKEILHIKDKTMNEYSKKYGESAWYKELNIIHNFLIELKIKLKTYQRNTICVKQL